MSRRVHRTPLALASDGTIFVNVAELESVAGFEDAIARAAEQNGSVFIGVAVRPGEMHRIVGPRVEHATAEIAALVAGARRSRRRK